MSWRSDGTLRLARLGCAALLALAGACATTPPRPPSVQELDRQVLLMLRSAPPAPLRPWDEAGPGYGSSRFRTSALRIASELAARYHLRVVDDWPMPSLGVHCVVLDLDQAQDPVRVLTALNADARVAWAQRMNRFRTLGQEPDLHAAMPEPAWGDLDALHRISTGRRVVIAQIDTGVDLNHRDLKGQWLDPQNFVPGSRFSTELHGTGVAGVIVARPDTSVGLVGVAPGARVMPVRACWQSGADGALCSSFTLAKSLQYALRHGARVINLSLAGAPDLLLERLLDRALDEGIVVVAAAQEDGADPGFPASHPRVIAVARSTPAAPQPRVVRAPGDDVLTTTPNDSFAFLSGASFAAAHITGLTALLLELSPHLSPSQVQSLLRVSAGEARQVNPCAALTALMPKPHPVPCQPFANALAPPATTR